jgi:hypothetical protein
MYPFSELKTELTPTHKDNEEGLNLRNVVSNGRPSKNAIATEEKSEDLTLKKPERIRL